MAESNVPVPKKLAIHTGNVAENWRRFKESWELYVIAAGFDTKASKRKVALLLTLIGEEAYEVFKTFEFTADENQEDLDTVVGKFENYCNPSNNVLFETYKFGSRRQEENEGIDSYATALRILAANCNFQDKDRRIRDQLVLGLKDDKVRERLLREADPDLTKVIEVVRANEIALRQAAAINEKDTGEANKVNFQKKKNWKPQQKPIPSDKQAGKKKYDCKKCCRAHEWKKCPAFGKKCNRCGEMNHFEEACTKQAKNKPEAKEEAKLLAYAFVFSVGRGHKKKTKTVTVAETGEPITFNIDTGASINTISVKDYGRVTGDYKLEKLKPTKITIVTYGGKEYKAKGIAELNVTDDEKKHKIEVYVVKIKAQPLLSLKTCEDLGILKILNCDQESANSVRPVSGLTRADLLRMFPDVFKGLGKLKGKYRIKLKAGYQPVIHAPRKFPIALRDELKAALDKMVMEGILAVVTEPTEWVSSLLVKREPNKLRICIDPKDLNNAIMREHYPLPRIEEVATRIHDVKVFSTLDARLGFWQKELDDESSLLTTFNTPFGRYRFLRMPFGISPAPEVWQRAMHEFIEGLNGMEVIADDFLVVGRGETYEEAVKDHDRNIVKFLEKARAENLKLNDEKMKIKQEEVTFIGHVLTKEGLKVDPRKVEAVTKMPDPQDENDLKRFLGMVQYLAKFLPKDKRL